MNKAVWALLVGTAISTSPVEVAQAQSPAPAGPVTAPVPRAPATLSQLMKGTFYPSSNVVFASQNDNPADVPWARDPNMATDLLASVFGKWEAVENSALALAEVADLLSVPGRKCTNGLNVPVNNADWSRFVNELKAAGMTAYAAAQTRNQDKMIDASDVLSAACKNCHDKYRDRRKLADRCK